MRNLLLIVLLFVCSIAHGAANDVTLQQRNSENSANITRTLTCVGGPCIFFYNSATLLPGYLTLGTGLSINSGVLSATGGTGSPQVNADWAAVGGIAQILNKPTLFSGAYADLTGKPTLFDGAYSSLTGVPDLSGYATTSALASGLAGKANSVHTHVATDITDSTATGRSILTAPTLASARSTLGVQSTSEAVAAYYPLSSNPSGYLTGINSAQVTSALGLTPISLAGARASITLTTAGSGAATYNSTTGALNVPVATGTTPFNFSQPTARTLAVSTSYQALDNTKAAIIFPSYACQNATQVLVSSACTVQVRIGTGALTCSTGTVYYTQSLTVALGVLITQNSTNPVPIFLPSGASMIMCPTAGTFTISAVEQSAG